MDNQPLVSPTRPVRFGRHWALVLLFVCAPAIFASRHEHLVDAWRPVNFSVAIELNDTLTEITRARTEIEVQVLRDNLSLIDLDFGDLPITALTVDGKAAQFQRLGESLNVQLATPARKDARLKIAVEYHGKPKDGLILLPDKDGRASATGDNWPNRVHHWIPCLDHPSAKATVNFTITAPKRDIVVANGKPNAVSSDTGAGGTLRTWSFTEAVPIPAYCMVIAVGEYANVAISNPISVTSLSYYVPPSDSSFAGQGFSAAPSALKFFSETVAPYPYEKLALIVGATRFGGMENSSAIVFASNLLDVKTSPLMSRAFNVPQSLESVVAHEIAHQWFGDSVTESTWSDLWLSEGFATYFAGLFIQKYDGEDAFRDYMKRGADAYLAYEKQNRAPIHDTETENLMALLNATNYQKGAWVLHMLRSELGDDAFFRGLRAYYSGHKNANASTEDLRSALEKTSGRNLKGFFARWVYGSGHPQYELSWGSAEFAGAGSSLVVSLKQTQPGEPFNDPVPIEVTSGDVKQRFVIHPTGNVTTTSFPLKNPPTAVVLDPDGTLLKEAVVINR